MSRRSQPQTGFQENPTRRSAGISTAVCTTMPSVVPMPRTSSFASPRRIGSRLISPGTTTNTASIASTTTLFHTGAHANGPNTRLLFRIAPSMAPMP